MLKQLARGVGALGPGPSGTNSMATARTGWTTLGNLPMVSAYGIQRWATYRAIFVTNPWVYSAVTMLSKGIARLPLQVYALDDKGRRERVRGDVGLTPGRPLAGQALDRLLSGNGFGMSRNAMFGGTMIDRLIYGNALWRIDRANGSTPTSLTRIRWRDMLRVAPDTDGKPYYYEYRPWNGYQFGPLRQLAAKDVVHFGLGSDPEGLYGLSPLEACRHTLALHEALVRHLLAYFQNSARPSGVFKVDSLAKERIEEIRQMLVELYTSPENAGKILATTGEWQEIGHSPDHSQIVDLVKLSREEIAAAYSVPPPVLGILDQAIKSNVKELREQYGRDSLGPWASDLEGDLEAQLLTQQPSWSNLFVEFQMAELLRPDLEARALVYQRLAQFFSIDEIRGFENLIALDLPGISDVPWMPRGWHPITEFAAEVPAPRVAPDESPDPAKGVVSEVPTTEE